MITALFAYVEKHLPEKQTELRIIKFSSFLEFLEFNVSEPKRGRIKGE